MKQKFKEGQALDTNDLELLRKLMGVRLQQDEMTQKYVHKLEQESALKPQELEYLWGV